MDTTKIKAGDLMQTRVARLDAELLIDDAISLLEADRISGAPVVDAIGRVVGVLSLSDLARAKEAESRTPGGGRGEYYLPQEGMDDEADELGLKHDYSPDTLPTGTVAEWMSEDVVSVAPGDSVRVVCKRMADRGIHRVLVLEEDKLVGILSSFDVVRWIGEHG